MARTHSQDVWHDRIVEQPVTFLPPDRFHYGFDVAEQPLGTDYGAGLDDRRWADAVAQHLGGLNFIHPFRDGNGRMMRAHLQHTWPATPAGPSTPV